MARGTVARHRLAGKGTYIADMFSGSGAISCAAHRLCLAARGWEVTRGSEFDVTHQALQCQIRSDAQRGLILAASLAPPCASFSSLQNLSGGVRNSEQPWGFVGLTGRKLDRVIAGNRNATAAIKLFSFF